MRLQQMDIRLGHCLVVFLAVTCFSLGTQARQEPSSVGGGQTLGPVDIGLLPVPVPRLENLEEAVRTQIESLHEAFRQLVASNAEKSVFVEVYGVLGQVYQAYQLLNSAETAYLNAVRLDPRDFRWIYLLGVVYQDSGRLEEAALYFREVRTQAPEYLAAACRLGEVHLQNDRIDDAVAQFTEALQLDPDSVAARAGLGEAELARKNYQGAIDHFQAALKAIPEADRLHYLLAMSYRGLGDLEKAREHLERRGTVGVRPADPLVDALPGLLQGERAYTLRGRAAYAADRYSEAAAAFEKAVEAAPESARAHVNLAAALQHSGDAAGAAKHFEEALSLDPKNAAAHFNLASLAEARGDFETAVEHFKAVVRASPNDFAVLGRLALLLRRAGKPKEAADYADSWYALQPSEDSLLMLAGAHVDLERYREARDLLADAYQRHPESGRTALALSRILSACPNASLRDGPLALKLAFAVYRAEQSMSTSQAVAEALAESGRCEEAAAWQSRVIQAAQEGGADGTLLRSLQGRLDLYRQGAPCRPPFDSPTEGGPQEK